MGNEALGGGALFVGGSQGTAGNAYGGSIYLAPDSMAIFQRCSFVTNQANGADSIFPQSPGGWTAAGVGQGGAIYNLGLVQTLDSLLLTNTCKGGQFGNYPTDVGQGGAVYSTNALLIAGCTLAGNSAVGGSSYVYRRGAYGAPGDGGAVWSSGDLSVTNSTFTGNSAIGGVYPGYGGGGSANGGGVRLAGGTGTLMNVTVSGNRVDSGSTSPGSGPALGGGLSCATNGTVTIRNSIIANSGNGGDTWGTLTDAGYNICSDSTANFSAIGSLNNTNPLLGPLADNGGPTPTMLLLPGSAALDAIPAGFPPVDQRGVMRPQGVAADIGAVEGGKIQSVSSQIVLKPSRTDLNIMFQATAGSNYRLLASPDLVDWTPVASLSTNSSERVQFTQPVLPVSQQFFEVQTP
jgi:hypothetical protein